ncbi:hypothetical protein UP06_15385 [Bradyrhizobium sp. LTSP857]|nr:hypothetical protein UP06_15385 [Bradyrhizobium sp. LTSP857]
MIENEHLSLCQSEPTRVIQKRLGRDGAENVVMKSFGDFPKMKISVEEIVPRRTRIGAPRQGRLLLDERKGHGTSPNWTGNFLQ